MADHTDPSNRALATASLSVRIRTAGADDVPELVRLINAAFAIERFFKRGDRTAVEEIRELSQRGEFLLLEAPGGAAVGCVYWTSEGDDGYFGMLSIDPDHQGNGFGRLLIDAVESRCRAAACPGVEIHIVNLREELPPFYRRLGYLEAGTVPFPVPEKATRPCHFIVMTKSLR